MERLSDISNIKAILSRHGFTFSRSLGQNFLINPSVCPKMAAASGAGKGAGVIEIGPGIGVLTCELAKLADKVVAIELDKRLLPVLNETLSEYNNIKIINDDALKVDFKSLIEREFSDMPVYICANLPYYITSPVIMRLLESKLNVGSITVMVQKEAALRLCAAVGTRQSSSITVAVNYYAQAEMLFGVSAGSFLPAPKVDSAVIRLNINKTPPVCVDDEAFFFKIIQSAFGQRRKTVLNSISFGLGIDKPKLSEVLKSCGIPENYRAEQLTLENFSDIANILSEQKR